MNIFKAKYKMHRLVNVLFYGIVFVIGLLLGFGIKKVDLSEIFSKVLFIDNVNAYSFNTGSYTVSEEVIIDKLSSQYVDFNIADFPYIIVSILKNNGKFTIIALSEEAYSNTTFAASGSNNFTYSFSQSSTGNFIYNTYTFSSDSWLYNHDHVRNNSTDVSPMDFSGTLVYNNTYYRGVTNFNLPVLSSSANSNLNQLDFSQYIIPEMVYNDSLFDDDSNFKQVCVNNYDKFTIVSNDFESIQDGEYTYKLYSNQEFMWFKNGVYGLKSYIYDSDLEGHVNTLPDGYNPMGHFGKGAWLDSLETIDYYFNNENSSYRGIFIRKNYNTPYDYYNYTFYAFVNYFNNDEESEHYFFNVFYFENPYIEFINEDTINSGGGAGHSFGDDFVDVEHPDKYCFYIKNEFNVKVLQNNEWNDIDDNLTILGGEDYHINTTSESSKNFSDGLFSNVVNFMSRISSTIHFINSHIYNLFLSMPLIVRMFLTSVLTIFIVKYIIDMIVR